MQRVELQVAGHGYNGGPAGSQGAVVEADTTGSRADEITYKIEQNLLGTLVSTIIKDENLATAYLPSDVRQSLRSKGVLLEEEDVRGAGHSSYVLWRRKA